MAAGWSGQTGCLSAPYRTRLCVAREASALADGAHRTLRPRYYAGATAPGD